MYLAEIKNEVSKFAQAISKILDIDVMIIDSNYNRIANTFRYVDEPAPITRFSMLGEVLYSGRTVAVKDKSDYEHCRNCKDADECVISGLIGVPVFFDNKVVGAIALLVPLNKTSPVFDNLEVSIDFLERMADLLGSKLKNIDDYNKLNVIKKEREIIIETIDDALVFVSDVGEIIYYNHQFANYFKINNDVKGNKITDLLDHFLIKESMMLRKDFSYRTFNYQYKNVSFFGFMSCRNIIINGTDYGALLTFKNINKIYNVLNEITQSKTDITFSDIERESPGLGDVIGKAKQLAVTDENILIVSNSDYEKYCLPRAVHNFSNRSRYYFAVVDCADTPHEMLEEEIFGEEEKANQRKRNIGKLRMADRGTIYFENIERLPLYIQKRIVDVLKNQEIKTGSYSTVKLDVRMIFHSSVDLLQLVRKGMFVDELYYRINKNVINVPEFSRRKEDIKIYIDRTIDRLKKSHHKLNLIFCDDALNYLYSYPWDENTCHVERILDFMIYNCENEYITSEDIEKYHSRYENNIINNYNKENIPKDINENSYNRKNTNYKERTLEEIEKDVLKEMLDKYGCKNEVAKIMGIGRATLYRKLRKFELM